MAGKGKYFHVKHKQTGAEHLVRAGKPAEAIAAVAGDRSSAVLADSDAISDFYAEGGQIHPNSAEAGSGKLFFVPAGEGRALVRAKNAGEAFGKVNGSDLYDAKLLTQDELVDLLGTGLKPVKFEPKQKAAAAAGDTGAVEAVATTGDGEGQEQAASTDDAQEPAGEVAPVIAEATGDAEQSAANEEGPADAAA